MPDRALTTTPSDLRLPLPIQSGRETWLDDAAATARQPNGSGTVLPPGPMEDSMPTSGLRLVRRHHVDLLRTASATCRP